MIATFTELKVKGLFAALKVALMTRKIRKQLHGAEGVLKFEVRGFRTFSLWKDREAMVAFRNNDAHLAAMKRTSEVGSATSHTWETETAPTWEELLQKSGASTALLVEKAGYLIIETGEKAPFNTAELATLASNAFNATQFMAERMAETNFSSMFQQGEKQSVLWMNIDTNSLLVVVFPAEVSVGAVKLYAIESAKVLAAQIKTASKRDQTGGLDLATLDPESADEIFKRKEGDS